MLVKSFALGIQWSYTETSIQFLLFIVSTQTECVSFGWEKLLFLSYSKWEMWTFQLWSTCTASTFYLQRSFIVFSSTTGHGRLHAYDIYHSKWKSQQFTEFAIHTHTHVAIIILLCLQNDFDAKCFKHISTIVEILYKWQSLFPQVYFHMWKKLLQKHKIRHISRLSSCKKNGNRVTWGGTKK